jgi:hypothetical protein
MARPFPLLLLLAFAATPQAQADEGPPPPITRGTLVGTWEAAPSWANAVYRLEINASGHHISHLISVVRTWFGA